MRKVRTGRGGITLTQQQMLEGFGGAEECQDCGALHCDICYPQRENVCVRCGHRALRLVMVHYATGTTALWPQKAPPALTRSSAGSKWAISLRRFLATQLQCHLETAVEELGAELSALPPPRARFFSRWGDVERRALQSAWTTIQKLAIEDRSPAALGSLATGRLLRRCRRQDDAESILLIGPDWEVRVGQSYLVAPRHLQDRILLSGLQACKRCTEIVKSLGDAFCEAEYMTRFGNGLYSAHRLEEAEKAFNEALQLWRALAVQDPELLTGVGRTLQHLGAVFSARGEYTRCASSYREAIEILGGLSSGQRDLAFALNNLGNFHLHRREYEDARSSFESAYKILDSLVNSGVTRSSEDPHSALLSMQRSIARANLALCLTELGEFGTADELLQHTIEEQERHLASGGDQARLQLAEFRAELGRVRLQLWIRESHHGELPIEKLLDSAIDQLSSATTVFREHLRHSASSAYLPKIVEAMTNFGIALGCRRDFRSAAEIMEEACALANTDSLWLARARALDARREIEVVRERDALAGFEYARRAVQTAEAGMIRLSDAERVNRDLVKSRIEMSYLSCIANLTRRGEYDEIFHTLEAMRRIDRLAQGSGSKGISEIDLTAAKTLAKREEFTYIATQAAPGGTVFFVIHASGEVHSEAAVRGWAERAFQFSKEIDGAARAMEFFGEPDLSNLKGQAASLFDELPTSVKQALMSEIGPIFLSMGGDQQNLPIELLFDRSCGWLGLQRIYARVRSFEELARILERQPGLKSPSALIAAGCGEGQDKILAIAQLIGEQLASAGFSLHPGGQVLGGTHLTRWKFLDNIDRKPSIIVFVGHGGSDRSGGFLMVSADDRLRPADMAQLRFDAAPLVHLECCMAGQALYFGGGYWDSYAVSLLAVGAACCLLSNRIIFGTPSELLCRDLYDRLLGTKSMLVGTALLETRRRIADIYPNPLFWATPVLYGNPYVRLCEVT
jgi:tetratricopeptide (TPR) repeat protein